MSDDLARVLLFVGVLIPSVILHEVAHGVVALRFGDDTAQRAGRLTLNPVKHIDPVGTVILPAALAFLGAGIFGYAKPVPVDRRRMRKPRDHGLVVSLAGPAVNIVLAVGAALLLRTASDVSDAGVRTFDDSLMVQIAVAFGVVNVVLAAFNLLPIPPLDGSAVVERLLPRSLLPGWHRLRAISMPLVLAVVLLLPGVLGTVFRLALDTWSLLL